jgi:hypothetical protein
VAVAGRARTGYINDSLLPMALRWPVSRDRDGREWERHLDVNNVRDRVTETTFSPWPWRWLITASPSTPASCEHSGEYCGENLVPQAALRTDGFVHFRMAGTGPDVVPNSALQQRDDNSCLRSWHHHVGAVTDTRRYMPQVGVAGVYS